MRICRALGLLLTGSLLLASAQQGLAVELLINAGFEAGDLSAWTVTDQAGGSGSFFLGDTSVPLAPGLFATPLSIQASVGPAAGAFYAVSDQTGGGAHTLTQAFTVPSPAASVVLTFDMFVNDWSGAGPVVSPAGLDFTAGPNQHARVDILSATAGALDTGPAVLANLFLGVDAGPPPNAYTGYTFDLTSVVGGGGTFVLRFAEVDTEFFLNQGVDSVGIDFTPLPTSEPPTAVLLLAGILLAAVAPAARRRRSPEVSRKGDPAMLLRLLPVILALGLAALSPALGARPAGGHAGNTDPDVIHACIGTYGGVRVVGPSGSCTSTETAKHWLGALEVDRTAVGGIQAFSVSGTFTIPAGVSRLLVEAWAGGGGAGGGIGDFDCNEGGGGGAGGFVKAVVDVIPGVAYDVAIGARGAGGFGGFLPTAGGPGGDTVFGRPGDPPLVVAEGGAGGGGATETSSGLGGAGGGGQPTGALVIPGQPGARGFNGGISPTTGRCEPKPPGSPLGLGGEPAGGTRSQEAAVGGDANYTSAGRPGGAGFLAVQW